MLYALLAFLALPPDPPELMKKDHGPGTTGGGVTIPSGETLAPERLSLSLRLHVTSFESLSDSDIQSKTLETDPNDAHFDAVDWTLLGTAELQYGVAEGIQVGLAWGYYVAEDLREGHVEAGVYELHDVGGVSGITDLWLGGKVRVLKGPEGSLSILGGIKAPVGDNDEKHEGERLDPSLQPGSGSWDFMIGAAYSRYLTERITLDAGATYIVRTEAHDFEVGDQFLAGVAAAYRFSENVKEFPTPSVFLELVVRHNQKSEEDGEEEENSGGTVLFLGPGARLAFSETAAVTLAVHLPVVQDLNEEQQETLFKLTLGLDLTF
jgi:hypothetical protein